MPPLIDHEALQKMHSSTTNPEQKTSTSCYNSMASTYEPSQPPQSLMEPSYPTQISSSAAFQLLPFEVLDLIIKQILGDDRQAITAASVVLSCPRLYKRFRVGVLRDLKTSRQRFRLPSLLTMLSRDFERHHICYRCLKFHERDGRWSPRACSGLFEETSKCLIMKPKTNLPGKLCVEFLPDAEFKIYWPYVQLALKGHRYGGDHGIPISAFDSMEVYKDDRGILKTLTTDARIVRDKLMIRSQVWYCIPFPKPEHPCEGDAYRLTVLKYLNDTDMAGLLGNTTKGDDFWEEQLYPALVVACPPHLALSQIGEAEVVKCGDLDYSVACVELGVLGQRYA